MLKSATFAPMQTASVRTAVSVKLLSFHSRRNASRQSCMVVDSPWTESAGNSFTGSFMSKVVTSTRGSPVVVHPRHRRVTVPGPTRLSYGLSGVAPSCSEYGGIVVGIVALGSAGRKTAPKWTVHPHEE